MSKKYQILFAAPFKEFTAVESSNSSNILYDIINEDKITLTQFCQSLFDKIFSLKQTQIDAFIEHHICLAQEPIIWLNEFEELITLNEEVFSQANKNTLLQKIISILEIKKENLKLVVYNQKNKKLANSNINATSEERNFSFFETKNKLATFTTDKDKILFLTNEKFEYENANIEFTSRRLPDFATQCQQEIQHIYNIKKLTAELDSETQIDHNNTMPFTKLKINIQLNQLADIFYQLTRELFVNGKPMIDGNTNDIINFIANSFVDKDGNEISPQSIKTMLAPSRTEKRPKPHKRIDIDKML